MILGIKIRNYISKDINYVYTLTLYYTFTGALTYRSNGNQNLNMGLSTILLKNIAEC